MNKYTRTRLHSRRSVLAVGSGALVAGSAGCLEVVDNRSDPESQDGAADNHVHSHDEGINGPVSHADVVMLTDEDGHHFEPHIVWVEAGGTVTWTNESGSHTTTAYHPEFDQPLRIPSAAKPWDSGMLSEEDATFEQRFEVDGIYDYFCIPHDYRAMVGTVIVGDPDPHDQPGLDDPQDDLPDEARDLLERLNEQVHGALDHDHDD